MTFGLDETNPKANIVRVHGTKSVKPFLDAFSAHGHVELDAARMYNGGDTEKVLGLLDVKDFKVATKVYPFTQNAHGAENLSQNLRDALADLRLTKVDIFYLHAPDRTTSFEETAKAIDGLYREGLFERFGLSNFASWEVALFYKICEQNGYVLPTIYQGMYNPLARSVVPELLPCLKKLNISFYAYNPVAGGLLTGKYLSETQAIEGDRYDPNTAFGNYFRERYWNKLNLEGVQLLNKAAKANNLTLVEATLRWMKHHSGLEGKDGIIIGASSLHHLNQNLEALEKGPLPQSMVDAFDQACDHVVATSRHYTL
ncbi:hypothetical protein BGZ76_006103 [Entomortierella beljakovae]|nr:hypothetical protein BGZ76_006103 [Entomortierella beljakovae]